MACADRTPGRLRRQQSLPREHLEVADVPGQDRRDHLGGVDAAQHAAELEQITRRSRELPAGRRQRRSRPRRWDLVVACSAGGILGAWARYGLALAVPHAPGEFSWSTVIINASGSLLIGALMVVLLELTSPHRLVRPFLGVGVLGAYTTYSTFAVDVQQLALHHRPAAAGAYILVTVVACGAAVWLSTAVTLSVGRAVITRRVRRRHTQRSSR
jgi:fluoride exporter